MSSSSTIIWSEGDDFAAKVAEPFWCCHVFETQRGDNFWGCLEHLPALHETVHNSKKFWSPWCSISPGCTHYFNTFCCSFTSFKKLYHHSLFPTWVHDNTVLLCNIKQESTLELLCSRCRNFAQNKFRHVQFQQWLLEDNVGSILWKEYFLKLHRRYIWSILNALYLNTAPREREQDRGKRMNDSILYLMHLETHKNN